jgi:hypothetical protein
LPFESWFLHLWFHFSLFAKNANSTHHAFVLLPFLGKMQTHPLLDFAFLFSFTQKCIFFFYMGFSIMRKAQIPLQAIATFAWFIKK